MDSKLMLLAAAVAAALSGPLQAQEAGRLPDDAYVVEEPDCVAASYPAVARKLSAAAQSDHPRCQSACDAGCDSCCNSGCDSCCDTCCDRDPCCGWKQDCFGRCYKPSYCKGRLLGVIAPSDTRFLNFISPMTNPVYFEDPRTLTEAHAIFINHQLPGNVLGGGPVQLVAVQLRAALTKRLSIIATKDGYIFAGGNSPDINGWANVNVGLKYNLFVNPEMQRIISVGTRYEMPVGSPHALQAQKGGQFDLFLTGGTQVGSYSHFLSAAGFRLPANLGTQNQQFYWSTHVDRRMKNRPIYGLLECNWYHWMTSGDGGIPGVGGLDLYNFGFAGTGGTNIVTAAIGLKYKPTALSEIGVAWEAPITARHDIIDNRITADLILRY